MSETITRAGQCACGAVRYVTTGKPITISACHCKQWQLRTGSAFGIGCYFPNDKVELLHGLTTTFERSSDSGRKIKFQFCSQCGTTVLWNAEILPNATGIAGGTFQDTDWIVPDKHVWTDCCQKWVDIHIRKRP